MAEEAPAEEAPRPRKLLPRRLPAEEAPAEEPVAEEAPAEEPAAAEEAALPRSPPRKRRRPLPPRAKQLRPPRLKQQRPPRPLPRRRSRSASPAASAGSARSRSDEQVEGRKPITRLPKPEHERGRRVERRGVVVSSAMDKTIVVRVDTVKAHPRYKKVVRRSAKFHAHDEQNAANVGDVVLIVETRPLSKTKNWRLAQVLEVAK